MRVSQLKRWVILLHLWLGVGLCVLFFAWFGSGIVMMYSGYPNLTLRERLDTVPVIRCAPCAPSVTAEALQRRAQADAPSTLRLGMADGVAVWRWTDSLGRHHAVQAADGTSRSAPASDTAMTAALAREFLRDATAPLRYAGTLEDSDQWTLTRTVRNQMPLHRWEVDDALGTRLYVSPRAADVVHHSTRGERLVAWFGAIPHWIYPWQLRRHADLWAWIVIVLSAVGTIACLAGLAIGVWQFRWRRRLRQRGLAAGTPLPRTPYRGFWLRWHHLLGLAFGFTTCTWVFSGMMSMNPLEWSPSTGPSRAERLAWSGGDFDASRFAVGVDVALALLGTDFAAREIQAIQVGGVPYWLAFAAASRTRLVRADSAQVMDALPMRSLAARAPTLLPGARLHRVDTLARYDAYYYDTEGLLPLPVVRAAFADADATTFYLNPRTGQVARKMVTRSRWNRWLYVGLHDFDLPWFGWQRPLWDVTLIVLSLGGMALSWTGIIIGWRWARAVATGTTAHRR